MATTHAWFSSESALRSGKSTPEATPTPATGPSAEATPKPGKSTPPKIDPTKAQDVDDVC